MSEAMSRANALAERMTRPGPTNPDALTLAVAAAERVCNRFPDLAGSTWLDGVDVEWSYFQQSYEGSIAGFYASALPVISTGLPLYLGARRTA